MGPYDILLVYAGLVVAVFLAARLFERDRVLVPGRAVWVDEDALRLCRGGRRQAA